MPLPFVIAGFAVAAGFYGIKKGISAIRDRNSAREINDQAHKIYDDAKKSLELCRERTNGKLEVLGQQKLLLYKETLSPFVETFSRIKNVNFDEKGIPSDCLQEVSTEEMMEIRELVLRMEEVTGGVVGSLATGTLTAVATYGGVGLLASASTGTAIASLSGAASTSATLAWLGGGSLATGGFGMAGGVIVLGGIVIAPALLVGGLLLASKSRKQKETALSNLSKAEAAAESMRKVEATVSAIGHKTSEVVSSLLKLQNFMASKIADIRSLVDTNKNYALYTPAQKELILRSLALAVRTKNMSETPLLNEDGTVTEAISQELQKTENFLKELNAI